MPRHSLAAGTDVPFDQFLTGPHLLKQCRVPDDPRRILDFAARFIQPRNDSDDSTFHDVGQVCNAVEAHAPSPFIHHLYHAKAGLADEVVRIVGR